MLRSAAQSVAVIGIALSLRLFTLLASNPAYNRSYFSGERSLSLSRTRGEKEFERGILLFTPSRWIDDMRGEVMFGRWF